MADRKCYFKSKTIRKRDWQMISLIKKLLYGTRLNVVGMNEAWLGTVLNVTYVGVIDSKHSKWPWSIITSEECLRSLSVLLNGTRYVCFMLWLMIHESSTSSMSTKWIKGAWLVTALEDIYKQMRGQVAFIVNKHKAWRLCGWSFTSVPTTGSMACDTAGINFKHIMSKECNDI